MLLKLTCKNLTEIVIKPVNVANCVKYMYFMVSPPPPRPPSPLPPSFNFREDLEILGWFKKGRAEKICYFRGDPKFKRGAVTLNDTMQLENISFYLW